MNALLYLSLSNKCLFTWFYFVFILYIINSNRFAIHSLTLYSGYFWGRKSSRIDLFQLFAGEKFHKLSNVFSKHFKGNIFMNGNWFIKFIKIFPLEKPCYTVATASFLYRKSSTWVCMPSWCQCSAYLYT